MARPIKNLANEVFGRWTVIGLAGMRGDVSLWKCRCECGSTKTVDRTALKSGASQSCGCRHKEIVSKNSYRHGMTNTPTYNSWANMLSRCRDQNNPHYDDYGGRGISVCDRWLFFTNFLADMGERPAGTTIERNKTNGNYEPSNCRWATRKEQQNNRRNTVFVSFCGKTIPLQELVDLTGIPYRTLCRWCNSGVDLKSNIRRWHKRKQIKNGR